MTSNSKYIKSLPITLIALTAGLLQPVVHAQSAASPGNESMQGSKANSSSMSGAGMGMKDMKNMDMQAMMKDNNDKMSGMKMTGKPDVDFAMMMRIHHQGAIDMSLAELRDGKAPEMRKMAKDIIAAQKKEIAQLDKFLAKNGHPVDKISK